MKRKMLIGIVAVILLAFGAGAAATKADFNGVWTLDADKNQGLPPGFTQTMTITQTGDRVNVESMIKVGDGNENVFKDIYILNGEENDFIPPVPENARKKAKRVSQWTDDETGFDATEEAVFTAPSGSEVTVRAKRRWRLSADGKNLRDGRGESERLIQIQTRLRQKISCREGAAKKPTGRSLASLVQENLFGS